MMLLLYFDFVKLLSYPSPPVQVERMEIYPLLDSCFSTHGNWKGAQSCSRLGITGDGLFQFGHSKDRRPDLPQVKVMLSVWIHY